MTLTISQDLLKCKQFTIEGIVTSWLRFFLCWIMPLPQYLYRALHVSDESAKEREFWAVYAHLFVWTQASGLALASHITCQSLECQLHCFIFPLMEYHL